MTQQEKENIQDDIEAIKAFGAYEDDLEKQKQSPLDAFRDALKGGDRAEKQALLDDFAKAAMQGMVASVFSPEGLQGGGKDGLAEYAYDIATAMMQERKRRMKG